VRLEVLDPADDTLMARRYELRLVVQSTARAHAIVPTVAEELAAVRTPRVGEEQALWSIIERGEMAGVVRVMLRDDHPHTARAQIEVLPRFRRRGYGARALMVAIEYAAARGRRRILGEAYYPPAEAADHEYRVFLEHNGFRLVSTDFVRALTLPVPRVLLDGIAAMALSAYFDEYRVLTFDEVPAAVLPSLVQLMNRYRTEAPTREIDWLPDALDPQRYVEIRHADADTGRDRLTTIAVEMATDQVVACTELLLRPGLTQVAQLATYVHPHHRGHRLGQAVCAANLRALQEQHPTHRDVHTEVNVDTPWLAGVYESLGFRPIEMVGSFVRDLG
jgi:GNAT superfamily N-acetyltransferase